MATADPFESLREPIAPVAPRDVFAAELRRRLRQQLGLPASDHVPEVREYTPARLRTLTPYLACLRADEAIEWYERVLGARLLSDPIVMDDGHIGHAELRVGDTTFMLAAEYPPENHRSPESLGGSSVALLLYVPDADATYALAVENGATPLRPVSEQYGARQGVIRDPFGHRWMIATALEADDVPVEDVAGRRYGDVGYLTFEVPDGERAERFFRALFGWQTHAGYRPGAFHIETITPPAGIDVHEGAPAVRLYFRVDDVEAAAARVRELGGQVLSVTEYESGGNAECVDDQGLRFDLFRPKPGY